MKKVFQIKTESISGGLIKDRFDFHVFAEDILEAVKKVADCSSKKMQIIKAKLFCVVEEDKDLEVYKEEENEISKKD